MAGSNLNKWIIKHNVSTNATKNKMLNNWKNKLSNNSFKITDFYQIIKQWIENYRSLPSNYRRISLFTVGYHWSEREVQGRTGFSHQCSFQLSINIRIDFLMNFHTNFRTEVNTVLPTNFHIIRFRVWLIDDLTFDPLTIRTCHCNGHLQKRKWKNHEIIHQIWLHQTSINE